MPSRPCPGVRYKHDRNELRFAVWASHFLTQRGLEMYGKITFGTITFGTITFGTITFGTGIRYGKITFGTGNLYLTKNSPVLHRAGLVY